MKELNNQNTYLPYFQEIGLLNFYNESLKNENQQTQFQLDISGYPADKEKFSNEGYP